MDVFSYFFFLDHIASSLEERKKGEKKKMEDALQVPTAPSVDAAAAPQDETNEGAACLEAASQAISESHPEKEKTQQAAVSSHASAASARQRWTASTLAPAPFAEMSAETMIPVEGAAPPQFPVVHPQGFRILNNASAMERNMRGYFRLPQPPNAATRTERRRLLRTLRQVEREEAERKACVTGGADGVVLDGFLILNACEADDPEEVMAVTLQASQLTSSVREDLLYFTALKTLDVSDNQLCMGDVLPFPHLETVHLVCNNVVSLADVPQSDSTSLSSLMALDLAYNRIPARDLLYLGACHGLRHLDLSSNRLRSLPDDLSSLSQLTHLALEANELASADVFHALGTLPALTAVNLARNHLSQVPLLHTTLLHRSGEAARDGEGQLLTTTPFPALQTMTLSGNRFADLAALLPLAALYRTLRHIAVGDNPFLERHPQEAARQLQRALDEAVMDLYLIAKDPAPLQAPSSSTQVNADMVATAANANGDTWQGKTWVRYLPPPPPRSEEEEEEGNGGGGTSRSRASSLETEAPPPPSAAAEEAVQPDSTVDVLDDKATQPSANQYPPRDPDDDVYRLTLEEYMERYHILVLCASPPPALAKQPKRYFYSSAYRATQEGKQSSRALVTLPPYNEFMDIYRIVGRQSHASRRQGRTLVPQRGGKMSTSAPFSSRQPALPVIAHPASTPPPPAAVSATAQERRSSNDATNGDEEESEVEEEEEGFFLTGVNSVAKPSGRRGGGAGAKKRPAKEDSEKEPVSPPGASAKDALVSAPDAPNTTCSGRNAGSFSVNATTLPRPPLPRSVVSPASTNVHTAVSELRAMLRKPLPSLPYEPTCFRQERRQEQDKSA